MEIQPGKGLNPASQAQQGGKAQQQGGGSAFAAALEKAQQQTQSAGNGSEASATSGPQGASQLVGTLRHQAVQGPARMNQALDLLSNLSADFAHGRNPDMESLKGADQTLQRLESQAMGEEQEALRGVRSAVNFYMGQLEREQGAG
jgi:hypothetical protein